VTEGPKTWLIRPRDPLIVRDGKPFSSDPGARAKSLPFPMPSTLIGAVRTYYGSDNQGVFDPTCIAKVLEIELRGPLLAEQKGDRWFLMAPAPADAILYSSVHAVLPTKISKDTGSNLSPGLEHLFVQPDERGNQPRGKPKPLPRYWTWKNLMLWLEGKTVYPKGLGHDGPTPEVRSHVKIEPGTQTAEEGFLFQTSGLEFQRAGAGLGQTRSLALAIQLHLPVNSKFSGADRKAHLQPWGGERRLSRWETPDSSALEWPSEIPKHLLERIVEDKGCRLMLLTPAIFQSGFMPDETMLKRGLGVEVKVRAVACQRYQVVSGWDFAKNLPKPTRRLTPAGSVYFLELKGNEEQIRAWARAIWMHPVSDLIPNPPTGICKEQDRRDGFGLAVLGVWKPLEHSEEAAP